MSTENGDPIYSNDASNLEEGCEPDSRSENQTKELSKELNRAPQSSDAPGDNLAPTWLSGYQILLGAGYGLSLQMVGSIQASLCKLMLTILPLAD